MSKKELASKIWELKELQLLADELDAMMEGIKDEIKTHMNAAGVEELIVDIHKVSWTPILSSRFDPTAFKSTHADLYGQYCRESITRRFTVA